MFGRIWFRAKLLSELIKIQGRFLVVVVNKVP